MLPKRGAPLTVDNIHEARAIGDWQSALKYAKKLIPKDNDLCKLVELEAKVENEIANKGINLELSSTGNQNDPVNDTLTDIDQLFLSTKSESLSKTYSKSSIELDARLLTIKSLFVRGQVDRLMGMMKDDTLDQISSQLQNLHSSWHEHRLCSLLADAFCFKGILLDRKDGIEQKYFVGPEADLAFQQFSKSAQLALTYMIELSALMEMSAIKRPAAAFTIGSQVAEEAMRRIPIYHIIKRKFPEAIASLRRFITDLNQTFTQPIRKFIIAQYATTMFCHIREGNFNGALTCKIMKETPITAPYFQPETADEEVFLALDDARFTYIDNAVVDEFPENEEARVTSRRTAFHTIDMHTLFCAKYAMFDKVVESYEEALKISFQNADAWFSYGLALMASKMYYKAYLVLKECTTIEACDKNAFILLAQICIDHLALFEEAAEILTSLIETKKTNNHVTFLYRAACNLYQYMEFRTTKRKSEQYLLAASEDIKMAKSLDPFDAGVMYFDAFITTAQRNPTDALTKINFMLCERPDDLWAFKLKILILTMRKEFEDALCLVEKYYEQNTDESNVIDFDIWIFRVYILCCCEVLGAEIALERFHDRVSIIDLGNVYEELKANDDICQEKMITPMPIKDLFAPSVTSRCDCFHSSRILVQNIWLIAAELYLQVQMFDDAKKCVEDATAVHKKSADNFYMNACIEEESGAIDEALSSFEHILSFQPDHTQAANRAASILLQHKDDPVLAAQHCRNALTVDATNFETWHIFSQCLYKQGYVEDAMKCIEKAVDLESTSPIVPLKSLCRPLSG